MDETRSGRMAAPDILRIGSLFIVAWFHFWQQSWLDPGFHIGSFYVNLQQIVRHGYMMVDELMLLSGFLLALPAARRHLRGQLPEPAEVFYRKRFWRIVPSYYLTLALTLFLWAIPQGLYASGWAMAKDLWAHLTFTHTLFYSSYMLTPMSGVLWTLAVEVQFYILWPIISRYFVRRPAATCIAMTALALSFRGWVYGETDCSVLFNQLPAQLDLYAGGMAAAMICARLELGGMPSEKHRRVIAPLGMLLCFAGMLAVMYLQDPPDYEALRHGQMTWRLPLAFFGGCFLLCGHMAPPKMEKALGNPVTRFLADVSFNFYMWHQFLALRLKDWHIPAYRAAENPNMAYEQPWQTRYTYMCYFAALVLAAALTFLWERPIRRWGLRRSGQKRDPA